MCAKSASRPRAFAEALQRLRDARSILAVTHARPDGDGLGCLAALTRSARAAGKTAWMVCPDAVPTRYQFLFAEDRPAYADQFASLAAGAEAIVILDACAFAQLDGLDKTLRALRDRIVVLDHHATGDDVGAVQWVDPSAAATGVMVGELLEALGWPVDAVGAEALAAAVVSDTGWLAFANTDARCLKALELALSRGLRMDRLYRKLYQSDRPERLRLMTRMLESLEMHCRGRLAVMAIRLADFQQTGAEPSETENLVNEALRIGQVETVALLVENDNFIRASLRSRDEVDVAKVARRFGGGGHVRAAGFRATGELDAIKRQVIEACTRELTRP